MPTGYTCYLIEDKEISFKEFALKCARTFSACIDMRDESMSKEISEEFKVSDYYKNTWEESVKKLEEFKSYNTNKLLKIQEKEYNDELNRINENLKKYEIQINRYNKMLIKVNEWEPPTKNYINLKKFMIQ